MTTVIKKGGKRQAFSSAKIRKGVMLAAKEAKLSSSKVKVLIKEVAEPVIALAKKKRVVRASSLRKSILGRLDRRAKVVSRAWRNFDKKKC